MKMKFMLLDDDDDFDLDYVMLLINGHDMMNEQKKIQRIKLNIEYKQ